MIDTKKSDDRIPDEILSSQSKWLKKSNGYFGLLTSHIPSILIYCISIALACIFVSVILVTTTNTTGYNQDNLKRPVNESDCTCNCWDGFYRGKYARKSKGTEYKFFYFNYKQETLLIFITSLFYIDLLVSLIKKTLNHILNLLVSGKNSLRWSVLVVLSVNVYSNFWYGWNLVNFLNDQDDRFFYELSVLIPIELLINFYYFNSLDRLSLKKGNYKPITMSTIAPIFCLNLFNFWLRLPHRLHEKFFSNLYTDLNKLNIDEFLFFLKEILGLLYVYFALKKTNRPSYPVVSKGDMKGKGGLVYFSLWIFISSIFYGIRYLIINRHKF